MHFVGLGEYLELKCANNFEVDWIFEPYKSVGVHQTFKKVSDGKFLTVRNVDYLNSGRYYCHGVITPSDNHYLVYEFSVTVHGIKIFLYSKYFINLVECV